MVAIALVWGIVSTAQTHIKTGQIKVADVISAVEPSADSSAPPEVAASVAVSPLPVVPGLALAALRQPASVGVAPTSSSTRPSDLPILLGATAIPRLAQLAYLRAATIESHAAPGCGLSWQILAGIGLIESNHARSGGSGSPSWAGVANPAILGPVLDGQHGYPAIKDTDHGVLDADVRFDRAVGPMQFLPATWREYAGQTSGASNPENITDAAAAAGRYLCASGVDLRTPAGLIDAVYGYNHSFSYVTSVVSAAKRYAEGALPAAAAALSELPALVANQPTALGSDPAAAPSPSTSAHPPSDPASGGAAPSASSPEPSVLPPPMPHPVSTPSSDQNSSPQPVTDSPTDSPSNSPTTSVSPTGSASPTDSPAPDSSTPTPTATPTLTPTATPTTTSSSTPTVTSTDVPVSAPTPS